MFVRNLIIVVSLILIIETDLSAHSPSPLGRGPVEAVVIEKSENDLIIKTAKGKFLISRAHTTPIYRGKTQATITDINEGDKIRFTIARSGPARIIHANAIFLTSKKESK